MVCRAERLDPSVSRIRRDARWPPEGRSLAGLFVGGSGGGSRGFVVMLSPRRLSISARYSFFPDFQANNIFLFRINIHSGYEPNQARIQAYVIPTEKTILKPSPYHFLEQQGCVRVSFAPFTMRT